MKILELCTSRIWGGGEVHLCSLVRGLLRRGHDVVVSCRPGSPLRRILAADGVSTVALNDKEYAGDLARFAALNRVDLIHAHQSKGARLAVSVHYLAGGARALYTRHSLDPPSGVPRSGLAGIIAVSQAVAAGCLEAGFEPKRVSVIYNGVDLELFHPGIAPAPPGPLGLPPQAPIVLLFGRLTKDKGVPAALNALLSLAARLDLVLLVLGEGPERPRLERMTREAGLTGKVFFLGQQPDVRPLLALAEVVVTPGPREAFGLAVLEAMAMGRPVVAIDAGGVPELVVDGRDGLLVPPGDGTALAASVYRLCSSEGLRRRLGAGARTRALEFGLDKMIDGTEAVMQQLLG